MSDDLIVQRLIEIYNQKILTKQELSEEEMSFISDNIEQMKDAGKINEQLYSGYVVGFILNPSSDIDSNDIADAISELKELEISSQVLDYGDGSKYTEYERMLYQLLNNSEVSLNDIDKARLINELENTSFTHACLHSQEMSGKCKLAVLNSLEEQNYATRDEYFQILYGLSKNENSGIEPNSLIQRIENARNYRLEEVREKQDNAYNSLLYLTTRDMKGIDEVQKSKILACSQDISFIRSIVETEYSNLDMTNDGRIALIARAGNQKYIEEILKGEVDIDLGENGLRQLVWQNRMYQKEGKDYFLRYAQGEDYTFSQDDKKNFILWSGDKDAAKEFLESNELSTFSKVQLLGSIGDRDYSNSFIEKQEEPLRTYLKDEYIRGLRNRGRKKGME